MPESIASAAAACVRHLQNMTACTSCNKQNTHHRLSHTTFHNKRSTSKCPCKRVYCVTLKQHFLSHVDYGQYKAIWAISARVPRSNFQPGPSLCYITTCPQFLDWCNYWHKHMFNGSLHSRSQKARKSCSSAIFFDVTITV